ncbi:uncharacterized protein LOC141661259 [Apium graveolens]|uniref:uncharacterized protein LOC141661259 n=1 Tax=Apium graveolens TaxID=4045 RepID=UPI003D799881
MVKYFFNNGMFDDHFTNTNIVLVPKKKNLQYMVDLRPISLCNVRYKIASKVLANRLKKVIDEIISEEQSAFIPGHIISNNIMIFFEIIHYMKRKTQGKKDWMALKLDMSKVYNRVEWSYIRAILGKMGFNSTVINLFMQCVTTARYKISHSGKEFGDIIPHRRLRQGDPMSSYLFLATKDEAVQVMEILAMFEQASGQKINISKSSVFFSRNVQQGVKNEILQVLGFHEAHSNTQYLRLPSCIGRSKTAVLGYGEANIQVLVEIKKKRERYSLDELGEDECVENGWRLITNPTSLVARMFKAKYYPNDNFLSAKLGANPSFIWRNILAAQDVLSQGMEAKPMMHHYNNPSFWKRLWNLQVPPKVKNFMWRVISGCLPTKDMLHAKKVNIHVTCSLCNKEVETASHVFLECFFAKSCWQEWVFNVFNGWETVKRQSGAMLCWTIWKCRNDLIWNQKCLEAQKAANSARNDGDERWTLPTENQTKVNTDAAVFVSSKRYSYAYAARNHNGELLEARLKCKEGSISPECAKIMGICEALSWIKAKHIENVVVETDCLVAVQVVRGAAAMLSYFGSLVQECREIYWYL